MTNPVLLVDLARELAVDRSALRKYLKARGMHPRLGRSAATRWPLAYLVTPEAAERVRELRRREGDVHDEPAVGRAVEWRWFSASQPVADSATPRPKVGRVGKMARGLAGFLALGFAPGVLGEWAELRAEAWAVGATRDGFAPLGDDPSACAEPDR